MDTPVVLPIFNRADKFEQVFERVAQVKPKRLFIVADGPRADRPDDAEKCEATRAVVDRMVDWDCDVQRNYAEQNMGCGRRLSSGFDWVFEQVERAIIVEDDCVPHPTFFQFCEEMLDRYADDPRVMHICGRSVYEDPPADRKYDYYFTRQLDCWGWATWRRAWQNYDFKAPLWAEVEHTDWLQGVTLDPRAARFFRQAFDHIHYRNHTWRTWAQQWNFTLFIQHGLGIRPYKNMVEYVGFDDHTHQFLWGERENAEREVTPPTFPLEHPPCLLMDPEADRFNYDRQFGAWAKAERIKKLKRPIHKLKRGVKKVLPIGK